jgi:hypothetical protein
LRLTEFQRFADLADVDIRRNMDSVSCGIRFSARYRPAFPRCSDQTTTKFTHLLLPNAVRLRTFAR